MCLTAALLLGAATVGRTEEPDAKYMRIYSTIEKADALAKRGQVAEAKSKYEEAQTALKDLKALNPNWNTKAVAYRLSYVTEKLDGLSRPGPAPTASAAPNTSTMAGAGALPAGTEIKLLSPGAEPREPLRLQVKPGEVQSAVMTLQLGMGGAAGMMKLPAIALTLSAEPKSVGENGDIVAETKVEDVSVGADAAGAAPMAEVLRQTMDGIKGMTIASTISDRGFNRRAEAKLPAGADAAARHAMEQMKDSLVNTQFMLPAEPVGPGAKWEIKQKLKSQGMTIDQTTTHHLLSREGTVLSVESTIAQSAAHQKIANPAMPQLKVDLTKMTGSSKAQFTVDLTKLLPTAATIDGGSELVMSAGAGAQAQAMNMNVEASIKLEAK